MRRVVALGWCVLLMLTAAAASASPAEAGPVDMRARVSALRYLPLMSVGVSPATYESLLHGKARSPKPIVVSRVYDIERRGARELGVIIARRITLAPNEPGIELVCRLRGQPERPRWVVIDTSRDGTPVEGVVDALAMEFRGSREPNGEPEWIKLPPVACGEPVWLRTTGGELISARAGGPSGLYRVTVPIRAEIAYSGKAATLTPARMYRILRIHDGVIEMRPSIAWDVEGAPDVRERALRAPIPAGTLPPTLRIKVSDVVDADGRLRIVAAYLGD